MSSRRSMDVSTVQFRDDEPSAGCLGLRHLHHHQQQHQQQQQHPHQQQSRGNSARTFESWDEPEQASRPGLLRRIATKLRQFQSAPELNADAVYTPTSREQRRKSILKPLVTKRHSSMPNIHLGRRLSYFSSLSRRSTPSSAGVDERPAKKSVTFADEDARPVVKFDTCQPPAWVLEKFTSATNQPWVVGCPAWRAAQRHASYPEEVLRTIPGNEEGDILILTDPPLPHDDNTHRIKQMPTARDGSFYVTHAPKTVIVTSDPLTEQHFGEAYVPGGEHLSLAAEAADAEAARWAKQVRRKHQMQQNLLRAPFADDPLVRTWQQEDKRLRQRAEVPQPRRKLSLVPQPAPKLCSNRRGSSFAALMFGRPPPPLFAV
ncbi:hypothetical protein HDU87_000995 [Geranomyces variabilis]|uniref:Uncharacterized protein n=1 Tax=Geranomyces variabilis TaxID=109894 RepID=A0AAD5XJ62_9FUNG|nr:hypothetical protein HDU87_000995 [Geranomyces variabilis]